MNQLTDIISYLKRDFPRVVGVSKQEALLNDADIISSDTDFQESVIYVGKESKVQNVLRFLRNQTLFLMKDLGGSTIKETYGNNIVLFPPTANEEDLLIKCKSFLKDQNLFYKHCFQLTNSFINQSSISEIIEDVASLIGNPIMVLNQSYRLICHSEKIPCEDYSWNVNIDLGYCSYEFISKCYQASEMGIFKSSDAPILSDCFAGQKKCCICRLMIDGRQLGYLLSLEENKTFTPENVRFLKITSTMIAHMIEDAKHRTDRGFNTDVDTAFLEYLEGNCTYDMFYESLKYTDLKLQGPYHVIFMDLKDYHNVDYEKSYLIKEINGVFNNFIQAIKEKNVILLVEGELDDSLYDKCKGIFESNVSISISDPFDDLRDIKGCYNQSVHTNTIAHKILNEKSLVFYDDVRLIDVLLSRPNKNNYGQYLSPLGKKIIAYDEEHNTEYLVTLKNYIRMNHSVNRTAEYMFIHKNTVSYRINKIKELFDVNLKDMKTCQQLDNDSNLYMLYQNEMFDENGEW